MFVIIIFINPLYSVFDNNLILMLLYNVDCLVECAVSECAALVDELSGE